MECPKCHQSNYIKNGIVKGKQRYLCKECKYYYTVEEIGKPRALKKQAINLYLEGLGFRSIERILKVSNVSVLKWVRKFGKEIEATREPARDIEIVEMDELHTYIRDKKTTVGSGLLLIGLGENSLISCLVVEGRKQGKNFLIK